MAKPGPYHHANVREFKKNPRGTLISLVRGMVGYAGRRGRLLCGLAVPVRQIHRPTVHPALMWCDAAITRQQTPFREFSIPQGIRVYSRYSRLKTLRSSAF